MQKDSSVFQVPGFARQEATGFVVADDFAEIYEELNAIAEEIEECRLKRC